MKKASDKTSSGHRALIRSSAAEYLTFVAASGNSETSVEMRYEDENIWLTQKMMAALYDVSVPAINQHLKRVFADNELEGAAVIKQHLTTAADGKNYQVKHYNLQAIIAVGFKIENERAVQFRKWANQIVKDYTIQGWTMDVVRLKHGGSILDNKFFERQLEKVREIRMSERKFYQKITDIYATSLDYDPTATATKRFFAAVQNKLHYAIHGQTAAFLGSMITSGRVKPASFWWTNGRFQDFQNTDFNVVTEKTLLNFIAKRPKILAMAEVRELGTLLEGSLRKERQSILKIGQ